MGSAVFEERKEGVVRSLEEGSGVGPGRILETTVRAEGFSVSAAGAPRRGLHGDGVWCALRMHTLPICGGAGVETRMIINIRRASLSKLPQALPRRFFQM